MKLSVNVADLSKEVIAKSLSEKSVSQGTIDEMISVLDQCEFAQYAPEGELGTMDKVYEQAAQAIRNIENEISES